MSLLGLCLIAKFEGACFFCSDPSLSGLPCWFQAHILSFPFSPCDPSKTLPGWSWGLSKEQPNPSHQWIQNETLGGNIWGWLTLLFLSAKRKWVLILKHESPLETVSLNEHLKLQIVFFFSEAAQNHIVVIFWFLSQPQIFKCQNLAKPPANVCHGYWPTKTANSNESLHSGSALKLHPAREAGTHLCPRTVLFCCSQWVCSPLELWGEGSACLPLPLFPSLLPMPTPLLLSFLAPLFVPYLSLEAWMYWEWYWHEGLGNGSSACSQGRFWGQSMCILVNIWFSYFLSQCWAKVDQNEYKCKNPKKSG